MMIGSDRQCPIKSNDLAEFDDIFRHRVSLIFTAQYFIAMIFKIYMIFLYPCNPVIRSNIFGLKKSQESHINYFAFFVPFGGSIFCKFGRDNQIYRIFLLLLRS